MDVTPGPQLRRQITVATERLDRFAADKAESANDRNLPEPDYESYAYQFAVLLREILALVRS